MRIIEFKGKTPKGPWVKGSLLKWSDSNSVKIYDTLLADGSMGGHDVDPESVCQFIGLFDAAGEPIYEGDIIQPDSSFEYKAVDWNGKYYGVVFWENNTEHPGFKILVVPAADSPEDKLYPDSCPVTEFINEFDIDFCQVVGNIFDRNIDLKLDYNDIINFFQTEEL